MRKRSSKTVYPSLTLRCRLPPCDETDIRSVDNRGEQVVMRRRKWNVVLCVCGGLVLAAGLAIGSESPNQTNTISTENSALSAPVLNYFLSKRVTTRWLRTEGGEVPVDVRITGCGVEAYLTVGLDVVVVEKKSQKALWAKTVGRWWENLAFVHVKDDSTDKDICLVRLGGPAEAIRLFDPNTGREKYLYSRNGELLATDEKRERSTGSVLKVQNKVSGSASKIETPRYVRILSRGEWQDLWNAHAKDGAPGPEVDFETHMVVAVFKGKTWNCRGIALEKAIEGNDSIEVFLCPLYYQSGPKADRATPFGIFVLPKSSKKIVVKENVQYLIGGPAIWEKVAEFDPIKN